ncbi:hypothetical protein PG996_008919 [Apiospora saccharicola]|uniref:Ankyrin repeat protein n=1 Tax=Apiospora saccharicola TaxID=335842 RepID=A0ABR1V017_9PEZI
MAWTSVCNHGKERLLIAVRKPGRPLRQCPHPPGRPCSCHHQPQSVTVALPRKSKCDCIADAEEPLPTAPEPSRSEMSGTCTPAYQRSHTPSQPSTPASTTSTAGSNATAVTTASASDAAPDDSGLNPDQTHVVPQIFEGHPFANDLSPAPRIPTQQNTPPQGQIAPLVAGLGGECGSGSCNCGPSCRCIGCVVHPYNSATEEFVFSAYQDLMDFPDRPSQLWDPQQQQSVLAAPVVAPGGSGVDVGWPVDPRLASTSGSLHPMTEDAHWSDDFLLSGLVKDDNNAYTRTRTRQMERWKRHPGVQWEVEVALIKKADGILEQVVDALAVNTTAPRHARFDPINRMPTPEDVLRCCSNLVVLHRAWPKYEEDVYFGRRQEMIPHIRLAHFSVQEYLLSDPTMAAFCDEITSRTEIVEVCLSYLLSIYYIHMPWVHVQGDDKFNMSYDVFELYTLAHYSAWNWAEHAKVIESSKHGTLLLGEEFLSLQEAVWLSYYLYQPNNYAMDDDPDEVSALYYASCTGLFYSVKFLLAIGADINALSGAGLTALHAALMAGHKPIVQLLLDKGAAVDIDTYLGTALHVASSHGDESTVELILENGAAIDFESHYGTALCEAAHAGHVSIAKLLLEKRTKAGYALNYALYNASHRASIDLIHLFSINGADIIIQDNGGATPLYIVLRQFNQFIPNITEIAELLLQLGADVNIGDKNGQTPLMVVVCDQVKEAV